MRFLVTGASGFIGSHVVRQLAQEGYSVCIFARQGSSLHRLKGCLDSLEIKRLDLSDYLAVHQAVTEARPDCAIHAAWYAVPGRYWTAPENIDCVMMSLSLAKTLAMAGCRRFVGIGSCFEYDYEYGYLSENLTPLKPRSLYAVSKDATRSVLESFCLGTQMSFSWARIFYVYGPGEQKTRLVPSVILSLMKGLPAKCTEGLQVRDYLCVEDVASALVAVARGSFEGAVNIGSGEPVTVRSIVQILGESLGRTDLIEFGAMKPNPVDPPFVLADVRCLREQVGWRPSAGLQEGLQRAVEWWKKSPPLGGTDL